MKTPMITIASSMVIANQSWARNPATERLKIIDRPPHYYAFQTPLSRVPMNGQGSLGGPLFCVR